MDRGYTVLVSGLVTGEKQKKYMAVPDTTGDLTVVDGTVAQIMAFQENILTTSAARAELVAFSLPVAWLDLRQLGKLE